MKRILAPALVLATSLVSATAFADDSDQQGNFGLGIDHSIADGDGAAFGGTGVAARFFVTRNLGLELVFGGDTSSRSVEGDRAASSSQFDVSLLVEHHIVYSSKATLSGYVGFGMSFVGGKGAEAEDDADPAIVQGYTDIAFELGLRGEVFLDDHFSIFMRGGINIDPFSRAEAQFRGPENEDAEIGGMDISIFRGDVLGMAGFTFWF
jgi:hypothetical protein